MHTLKCFNGLKSVLTGVIAFGKSSVTLVKCEVSSLPQFM